MGRDVKRLRVGRWRKKNSSHEEGAAVSWTEGEIFSLSPSVGAGAGGWKMEMGDERWKMGVG